MEEMLMFAPLSAPKSRWKSFVTGWGIQAGVVGLVLALPVIFPQAAPQVKRLVYTSLVAPVEPVINERQPINRHIVIKIEPLHVIEAPPPAKLVVPREMREIREPESEVKAPKIEAAAKLPDLPKLPNGPLTKVIATNTFATPTNVMPTTAKPTAQVQTGGFGDPNGIPGTDDGKRAANIAAKGSMGLPQGAGFGNGVGGTKGIAGVGIVGNGVIQSSGFDQQYAAPSQKQSTATLVTQSGTPVEIIEKPKPSYTVDGRKHGVEGEVRLEVEFTADNRVHVLRVVEGLGFGLDEQAVHAAEQIKFKPAMHGGRAIDSTAIVHIVFELAS
jgi:TonB family protein